MEMSDVFSFVLTDTVSNVEIADWSITSADLGLKAPIPFEIVKRTLHGGRQEGSTLITIKAGDMAVSVIPTRGMNVFKATRGTVAYGWSSPVDEIVHPAFMRLGERGGAGWLDGFCELMVRCGFEWTGHPTTEGSVPYTLHGRAASIPASKVVVTVDKTPPHRITVAGLIKEKAFKLADFETWASLSLVPGEAGFTVSDKLTNLSDYERGYQIIYHTNYGRPLLEAGARVVAPVARIAPFNDAAKPGLSDWETYLPPTRDYDEMVFAAKLAADADGKTAAALVNADASLGVIMGWNVAELPLFTLWKNTDTERQGYVTGLEPGTNYPYARPIEDALGRVMKVGPGASRTFTIGVRMLVTPEEVADAEAEIARLKGKTTTVVESEAVFGPSH